MTDTDWKPDPDQARARLADYDRDIDFQQDIVYELRDQLDDEERELATRRRTRADFLDALRKYGLHLP
jgi:hypothetical protein